MSKRGSKVAGIASWLPLYVSVPADLGSESGYGAKVLSLEVRMVLQNLLLGET
jgi:hypothetical protein